MKCITIILMIFLTGIEATSPQQLTYVKKEVQVVNVLKEILKQTGYNIIWEERNFKVDFKINANFKNTKLDAVLKHCFDHPKAYWIIQHKTIILLKRTDHAKLHIRNSVR